MEICTAQAFAAMCGVSPQVLKEYEKAGLFAPMAPGRYAVFGFYAFSFVHYLHNLGLSMDEVGAYLPGRNADAMKAMLTILAERAAGGGEETAEVRRRIEGQLAKLAEARAAEKEFALLPVSEGPVPEKANENPPCPEKGDRPNSGQAPGNGPAHTPPRLVNRPLRHILRCPPFDPLLPADGEVSARFLAASGAAGADIYGYSGIVACASAMGEGREAACAFFTDGATFRPLPGAVSLPAGPCVCAYFRGPMEQVGALYPALSAYAAQNGLTLGDECYVSYVLGGMSTEDPARYLLLAEWPVTA